MTKRDSSYRGSKPSHIRSHDTRKTHTLPQRYNDDAFETTFFSTADVQSTRHRQRKQRNTQYKQRRSKQQLACFKENITVVKKEAGNRLGPHSYSTCAELLCPPLDISLRGALLPSHTSDCSQDLLSLIGTHRHPATFYNPIYIDDDRSDGVLTTIGDIFKMQRVVKLKQLSRDITTNLGIHVQQNTNKLRINLPLSHSDLDIFQEYFDEYLDHATKRSCRVSMQVNGATTSSPALEYLFKAPYLPPFLNRSWPTKLYSTIFYEDSDPHSDSQYHPDDDDHIPIEIVWQHLATGVKWIKFLCNEHTRSVSCSMKLVTYRLFEPTGIVQTNTMLEMKHAWIKSL